jgi:two-component system chemotaxis response regulator CheB
MSEVKVVRRWPRIKKADTAPVAEENINKLTQEIQIVAIGASTGGPIALQTILSNLPKDFLCGAYRAAYSRRVPGRFYRLAGQTCGFPVHIATEGERLLPGNAYVAPDGFQMIVKDRSNIILSRDMSHDGLRPSVSYLFESVAGSSSRML